MLIWIIDRSADRGLFFRISIWYRVNQCLIVLSAGVAAHGDQVSPLTPARDELGYKKPVDAVFFTELCLHLARLASRHQDIDENDNGEKRDGKNCRPVDNALAEKRDEKSCVLGVTHQPVEAIRDKPVFLAGTMQFAPSLQELSLIHISEPTRRTPISYAVFCLK